VNISFFNELDIEKELCSGPLFHFLMSFPQRRETMLVTSVSFFKDLSTEKRNYAHGFFLIMASKRIILWKDSMSRDKTQSWIPRDLRLMEDNHSGKNTCRAPRQG
jgi:hypothetical protein